MQFNESNTIGKYGEAALYRFLNGENWSVMDVSDSQYFRSIDVDMVIQRLKQGDNKGNGLVTRMVDVKCDSNPPINFAVEFIKNDTKPNDNHSHYDSHHVKGSLGCAYTSQADYWLYLFKNTNDLFIFSPADMREYVNSVKDSLRTYKHPTRNPSNYNDIWYHSHCYLVNIKEASKHMSIKHRDLSFLFD